MLTDLSFVHLSNEYDPIVSIKSGISIDSMSRTAKIRTSKIWFSIFDFPKISLLS